MVAAAPNLRDEAELARIKAVGQIHVLMRAAGVRVTEDELRSALQLVPDTRLRELPTELADAVEWHRQHAPGELNAAFRGALEQLQRDAAAAAPPATAADLEAEIAASRAERRRDR